MVDTLNLPLRDIDPDVFALISNEEKRQAESISLIPPENLIPRATLQPLSSVLANIGSDVPDAGGDDNNKPSFSHLARLEELCKRRALDAYGLYPSEWRVVVDVPSEYAGILTVYDAVVSMKKGRLLLVGGTTHDPAEVSPAPAATYFDQVTCPVSSNTGLVDYDDVQRLVDEHHPTLIMATAVACPRLIWYGRLKEIAVSSGALLGVDMSQIAGLVAGRIVPSPFGYADIVVTTAHETLRGPRGALIFYRRSSSRRPRTESGESLGDLESAFTQRRQLLLCEEPAYHTMAAIAVALRLAMQPDFYAYQAQAHRNACVLAEALRLRGHVIVTGGTDTHFVVVNVEAKGVMARHVEAVCAAAHLLVRPVLTKEADSAEACSMVQLGTAPMTTRGFLERDFEQVAIYFAEAIQIAQELRRKYASHTFAEYLDHLQTDPPDKLSQLREAAAQFALSFPSVGTQSRSDFARFPSREKHTVPPP